MGEHGKCISEILKEGVQGKRGLVITKVSSQGRRKKLKGENRAREKMLEQIS